MDQLTKHSKNFIFLIPILLDLKTYQKNVHRLNMNGRILSRVLSRFFDRVGHETTYASSGNKHFFTK